MPSGDLILIATTKGAIVEETPTTECVSLTIPLVPSAETGKINVDRCDDFGPSDLRSCVAKELVCTTVTTSTSNGLPSTTPQMLSPNEGIETTTENFDHTSSTTADLLLDRSNESAGFVPGETTTENSLAAENSSMNNTSLPSWAAGLKDCEMIGDCYRGYVNTEAELDLLLSVHKEHTNSCWGTRQSPSSAKPSVRLMWKSQYVPYDGVPFLNSGRRATVMECQYGPRRKGNKVKIELNDNGQPVYRSHRPTCPARIYIKKVRKFLKYRIDPNLEGTVGTRQAQERALAALRLAGIEQGGEDRYYVQFPLEIAHQYHDDDDVMISQNNIITQSQLTTGSRLDNRVVEKINELVARGVTGIYEVKHGVIQFVETELFAGKNSSEVPPRHNKTYFPTITDLQNHIHQAKIALETGTLATLPPPEIPPMVPRKVERNRKRKRSEPRRVRTPKSTDDDGLSSMCGQGEQLEVNAGGNLQTNQASPQVNSEEGAITQLEGQVFVMVPTASTDLFTTSDSGIATSLSSDKTSLVQMQVVTVPATAASYLEQQGDCSSLGLTGQYLSLPVNALPVVSYSNNEICDDNVKNDTINDSLGKDITSLMPSRLDNQGMDPATSSAHGNQTSTIPISPRTITIYNADMSICGSSNDSNIASSIHSLEKNKGAILNSIDKNQPVNELFVEESQIPKPNSDFSSTNTDMNSIPCYTEESYNSSLDIIKSHAEITTSPSVVLLREASQEDIGKV